MLLTQLIILNHSVLVSDWMLLNRHFETKHSSRLSPTAVHDSLTNLINIGALKHSIKCVFFQRTIVKFIDAVVDFSSSSSSFPLFFANNIVRYPGVSLSISYFKVLEGIKFICGKLYSNVRYQLRF